MTAEEQGLVSSISDPLRSRQLEDVAKMRASLLSCNDDPASAKSAIQNLTTLRIYHELTRIVKFTEMMDKIEEKMYDALDASIDNMSSSPSSAMMLLTIQEKLLKNMKASYELIQPYLDMQEFNVLDVVTLAAEEPTSKLIMTAEARDKLRANAQAVLSALEHNTEIGEVDQDE